MFIYFFHKWTCCNQTIFVSLHHYIDIYFKTCSYWCAPLAVVLFTWSIVTLGPGERLKMLVHGFYNADICLSKKIVLKPVSRCSRTEYMYILVIGWGLHWCRNQRYKSSTDYWNWWLLVPRPPVHCSGGNWSTFIGFNKHGKCPGASCGLLLCI